MDMSHSPHMRFSNIPKYSQVLRIRSPGFGWDFIEAWSRYNRSCHVKAMIDLWYVVVNYRTSFVFWYSKWLWRGGHLELYSIWYPRWRQGNPCTARLLVTIPTLEAHLLLRLHVRRDVRWNPSSSSTCKLCGGIAGWSQVGGMGRIKTPSRAEEFLPSLNPQPSIQTAWSLVLPQQEYSREGIVLKSDFPGS
jgi:hypothetical protein